MFLFNIKQSLIILIIGTLIQIYPIRKRFVGGKRLNGADYSALTFTSNELFVEPIIKPDSWRPFKRKMSCFCLVLEMKKRLQRLSSIASLN